MSRDLKARYDVRRYEALGLLANPFAEVDTQHGFAGIELAVTSEANRLLGRVIAASDEETPKPLVVTKASTVAGFNSLRAIGLVERSLATDDGVNVLHAYVQLFMFRLGRVRAILSVLAERLAFRDFNITLEKFISKTLDEPQPDLLAYQVLGEEGLQQFADRFHADPTGAVTKLFGGEKVERHPELAQMGDSRLASLESDVDDEDAVPEIDASIADSPANTMLFAEAAESDEPESDDQLVVDYIVEYAKVNYSPVLARGLRVFRERGLAAFVEELKITKAPKKTLKALARFARLRFKKVVIIFDGFESWEVVPADLKPLVASTLSEVRWLLEDDGFVIFLFEEGAVRELAEQFGGGEQLTWSFPLLKRFTDDRDALDAEIVDTMFSDAALPGASPITSENPVVSAGMEASGGFSEFARRMATAIENAADRGVPELDAEALEEARTLVVEEEANA